MKNEEKESYQGLELFDKNKGDQLFFFNKTQKLILSDISLLIYVIRIFFQLKKYALEP